MLPTRRPGAIAYGAFFGASVLMLLVSLMSWLHWRAFLHGVPDPSPAWSFLPALLGAFASRLVAFVALLVWVRRAAKNSERLQGVAKAKWSALWFFVPIANLFMPYVVIRDLALEADVMGRPRWMARGFWLSFLCASALDTLVLWSVERGIGSTVELVAAFFYLGAALTLRRIVVVVMTGQSGWHDSRTSPR